ncbi:MAG: replication initiator protein A [Pirellulales bacterium]|nr:replication initiator protein A [Pirellulales bacterium]
MFSLSTKPDHHIRRYEHGDCFVEVKPSADGLATVHDRDILIYCISQVMAALNGNQPVSQVIRFRAHDLLRATNRMTNGRGYEGLKAALERLAGTRISTNVTTGSKEIFNNFGLIERFEIVRESRDGRMQTVEVKLSDWVFNALEHREVLTLHRDYFRLRKPIERRIYEIGRKHCGRQAEWRITLPLLQKKCGATSSPREFRRLVTKIIEEDQRHAHIPDYSVEFQSEDMILFRNRGTIKRLKTTDVQECDLRISTDAYEEAELAAPGWDVYLIEQEWRDWVTEPPRNADAAFIGFCRKWYEKRGRPR